MRRHHSLALTFILLCIFCAVYDQRREGHTLSSPLPQLGKRLVLLYDEPSLPVLLTPEQRTIAWTLYAGERCRPELGDQAHRREGDFDLQIKSSSMNSAACSTAIAPLRSDLAYALGRAMDINRAREEDLLLLPGIGTHRARAIVRLRKKRGRIDSLEELNGIRGMGPKTIENLKGRVRVDDSNASLLSSSR